MACSNPECTYSTCRNDRKADSARLAYFTEINARIDRALTALNAAESEYQAALKAKTEFLRVHGPVR